MVRNIKTIPEAKGEKMENDQNRVVYIDNMRNFLVFMVVALHALCVFCYPIMFHWAAIDKEGSHRIYEAAVLTLDVFLMPHLIFLAALFIFISLKDKTKIQYLKTRFKRLYVPVIVFVFCAGDIYFQILSKRAESYNPSYLKTFMAYWVDLVNPIGIKIMG